MFVARLTEIVNLAGGQNAFARACGISQSSIGQYLSGSEPNRRILVAMANAAKKSVSWLAEGEKSLTIENNNSTITATNCRDVNTQSIIENSAPGGNASMEVSERERQLLIGLREYFSPAEIRALEQKIEMRRGQVDDLA